MKYYLMIDGRDHYKLVIIKYYKFMVSWVRYIVLLIPYAILVRIPLIFLLVPCGGQSWPHVSFLRHSNRIVSYLLWLLRLSSRERIVLWQWACPRWVCQEASRKKFLYFLVKFEYLFARWLVVEVQRRQSQLFRKCKKSVIW